MGNNVNSTGRYLRRAAVSFTQIKFARVQSFCSSSRAVFCIGKRNGISILIATNGNVKADFLTLELPIGRGESHCRIKRSSIAGHDMFISNDGAAV